MQLAYRGMRVLMVVLVVFEYSGNRLGGMGGELNSFPF